MTVVRARARAQYSVLGKSCSRSRPRLKLSNAIHKINLYPINLYPLDSAIRFLYIYPLDNDLFGGQPYPTFEQLGSVITLVIKHSIQ